MPVEDYIFEASFCMNEDMEEGISSLSLILVSSLSFLEDESKRVPRYPKIELLQEIAEKSQYYRSKNIYGQFCSTLRMECAVTNVIDPDIMIIEMQSARLDIQHIGILLSFEAIIRIFLGKSPLLQSHFISALETMSDKWTLNSVNVKKISSLSNAGEIELGRKKYREDIK